ncbi:MAG: 6-hydroxymethylpterin diphosphokinase MptE-like protein [Treponema sp.]
MNANFRLHSKYNPQKEADNFVLQIKTIPLFIVITEPGESYLATSFRAKFPSAKIFAIRYTDDLFLEYDELFDGVWRPNNGALSFFLINHIPDEFFSKTIFLSWKPSEVIWDMMSKRVWNEIKEATNLFVSLIRTRSFFGKKWCKNFFNNLIFSKNIKTIKLDETSDAVFLTSGCSLERFIKNDDVKNCLKKIFVSSASSSILAINNQNISIDLVFATDGGFWAGKHLRGSFSNLAIPLEAFVPFNVLEKKNVVFLNYGSLLENYFFEKMKIPFLRAKRNGTVAGTAIEFLLEYSKNNIFISGLDLSCSKSFIHARPNENINEPLKKESKLCPLSSILAVSSFNSSSLKTYASWFSSLPESKKERLFRIGNEGLDIEGIKRIDNLDFINKYKPQKNERIEEIFEPMDRKDILLSFFKKIKDELDDGSFFKSFLDVECNTLEKELCQLIAFSDYVLLVKDYETKKMEIQKIIKNKIVAFLEKEESSLL